jgi:hypothetical protein
MKTATFVVLVAVLAWRLCLGQTPAQQEVLQFEHDACKAFLGADVAELERVLTPDFTLTLSSGEVSTRASRGADDEIEAFPFMERLICCAQLGIVRR